MKFKKYLYWIIFQLKFWVFSCFKSAYKNGPEKLKKKNHFFQTVYSENIWCLEMYSKRVALLNETKESLCIYREMRLGRLADYGIGSGVTVGRPVNCFNDSCVCEDVPRGQSFGGPSIVTQWHALIKCRETRTKRGMGIVCAYLRICGFSTISWQP